MALPKFLQPYLASYDLSTLDEEKDKELIITEVLNKGDYEALLWLLKTYSSRDIKKVLSFPTRGMWMKSVLWYWTKILDIKLPKKIYQKAILNLNP